jgi:hypothetical protein
VADGKHETGPAYRLTDPELEAYSDPKSTISGPQRLK